MGETDDTAKKVQEYKDNLIKKAEELIIKGFPEKIVKLNDLLATPEFAERNFTDVYQDLNIPVPDPIDLNNAESEKADSDEPGAKRARIDLSSVSGTKVMALPNGREDGNNFGVSIQEDTLAEIQSVETEAAAFFDQISRYFVSRAKVVSKVAKYPHIDDYRRAVQELDEKEFLSLWLVLSEVRNRYCSLHDIVIKNMEKLKKPRSSNAESLY